MNTGIHPELQRYVEREVSLEEAAAYFSVPLSDDERENFLGLVEWFMRRYPTPLERLRYIDQVYRRWTRPSR